MEPSSSQCEIRDHARTLARDEIGPRAAEVDRTEAYPWENVKALTQAGFMGMTIPEEYGGRGLSYLDTVLVVEEFAKVCGVTGRIVVEGNMGAIGAVMAFGNEAQKRLSAGLVLAGDKPAICITEPGAGSAASQMTTRADKKGDRYIINGVKHWITGGGVSKLHLIFARVFENDVDLGIGGFLAVRGEAKGSDDRHAGARDGASRYPGNRNYLRGSGDPRGNVRTATEWPRARFCRPDECLQRATGRCGFRRPRYRPRIIRSGP